MIRLLLTLLLLSTSALSAPNIVASIAPIHSLVSNITQGITEPMLLLKGNQSAHHSHLVPSQLISISQADLIITMHLNFEEGLAKPLSRIDSSKRFMVNAQEHEAHEAHFDVYNHHTWLSIERMQLFTKNITQLLMLIDEENSQKYQQNYLKLDQKLLALKVSIKQTLADNKKPLASYSNAFGYFIDDNQLNQTTLITTQHEERLSIFKVIKAKKSMQANQVKCLLSTTEVPPKRINILTEGLDIKIARLNIRGGEFSAGRDQYFQLMQHITNQVSQCLQ